MVLLPLNFPPVPRPQRLNWTKGRQPGVQSYKKVFFLCWILTPSAHYNNGDFGDLNTWLPTFIKLKLYRTTSIQVHLSRVIHRELQGICDLQTTWHWLSTWSKHGKKVPYIHRDDFKERIGTSVSSLLMFSFPTPQRFKAGMSGEAD